MAFTGVAARKFASPSCQQVRALSSRFSGSGCPESEGTRLSGERVITRADSFHSASTSTSRRTHPLRPPGFIAILPSQVKDGQASRLPNSLVRSSDRGPVEIQRWTRRERFPRTESLAEGAPVDSGGLSDHGHFPARRTLRTDQSTSARVLVHPGESGGGMRTQRG